MVGRLEPTKRQEDSKQVENRLAKIWESKSACRGLHVHHNILAIPRRFPYGITPQPSQDAV